jgi:hypothetical protein
MTKAWRTRFQVGLEYSTEEVCLDSVPGVLGPSNDPFFFLEEFAMDKETYIRAAQ